MFSISCRDSQMSCVFELESEDKGEVLSLCLQHARSRHQSEITPKLVEDLSKIIRYRRT